MGLCANADPTTTYSLKGSHARPRPSYVCNIHIPHIPRPNEAEEEAAAAANTARLEIIVSTTSSRDILETIHRRRVVGTQRRQYMRGVRVQVGPEARVGGRERATSGGFTVSAPHAEINHAAYVACVCINNIKKI